MIISPEARSQLIEILQRTLPDTEVWAFGSRIKGTARAASDLDLVAFTNDENALFEAQQAMDESWLPFRVDLHGWHSLPENMREQITRQHEVLLSQQ